MTNVQAPHTQQHPAPPADQDDAALALAAPHDPTAFAELYRRHLARVYRYLLARVGDTHLAQDLTAQTFLAALEGISRYRHQGVFLAWLLSIARHKANDHFRRRRTTVPLETIHQIAAPDPLPDHIVAEKLRMEQVTRALQAIAPDRAEAITLRIFSGLSAAEIGQVMGKSEAAVKMLIHRAMRDLQDRLAFTSEGGL